MFSLHHDRRRPIALAPNWTVKDAAPNSFLLLGVGPHLDQLADAFSDALEARRDDALAVGPAAEAAQAPGAVRVLRALASDRGEHHAAADLTLRRQGDDVFLRWNLAARTRLKHLQFLLYAALFLILWTGAYGLYFSSTDAYGSLLQEYVRKWNPSAPPEHLEALLDGWRLDEDTQQWRRVEPITLLEVFRRDPKIFLMNLAGPPTLLAGLVGGLLALLPRAFIHLPCRLLGWPIPAEFSAFALAHLGWSQAVLSKVLYDFGITDAQRIPIGR